MSSATDTRERLLDCAERLFAAHGQDAVSLRQITGEAQANLAAVNYHFGSKQELVRAVVERRLVPMNAERLERLAALQAEADGAPLDLAELLRAFLAPALSMGIREGGEFFVFIARALGSPRPELRALVTEQFEEIVGKYGAALSACLPGLSMDELFWRMHFVIGALCHTVINADLLEAVTSGVAHDADERVMLERLVSFATAGMRAGQTS